MENIKLKKSTVRIIILSILFFSLFCFILIFIKSFDKKYKIYKEIITIYNGIDKNDLDGDILIIIKTKDGNFRINNIISNIEIYNMMKSTLYNGDEIIIYYYGSNSVLGIKKGDFVVLDTIYSINKLENNNKFSIIIFPILIITLIVAIIYYIFYNRDKEKVLNDIDTLLVKNKNNKTVIKFKVPLYLIIIHTFVVFCSFIAIPYIIKAKIWYVYLLFVSLSLYNFYRLICLFVRKIEINNLIREIALYTPIQRKVKIDMIENITVFTHEAHEGNDRFYIKIKIKNKRNMITIETTSNEQSNEIKALIEKFQTNSNI